MLFHFVSATQMIETGLNQQKPGLNPQSSVFRKVLKSSHCMNFH